MDHLARMEKNFCGANLCFDPKTGIAILKNSKAFLKRYPYVSFLEVCRLQSYNLLKILRRYCEFFRWSYFSDYLRMTVSVDQEKSSFYSVNGAKFGISDFLL